MYKIIAQEVVNNSSAVAEAVKLIVCGSIGGAVVGGIVGALGKLWVDRKLDRQRARYNEKLAHLEAELSKKHTIHKLQFEKEFSIYLDLWKALVRLRNASAALMPMSEFIDLGESQEQRKARKAKEFEDAYDDVVPLVEDQRPFFAPAVYEEASKLLSEAWVQGMQVIRVFWNQEPQSRDYKAVKARVKDMSEVIEHIELSIRERIGLIGSAELVE